MSEGGWGEGGWGENGQREPLPKVEDLPIAEQGYDREAVREAFASFYRHAAQLDSTLRVLESVEAFGRQARELRADIRSLRAASWGPAPSAGHVWSVGHEVWSPQEPPAAFAASLPRLAVWAALIVAVGVGAALAELSTVLVVLLVVAAWALVALIEVAIASRRAGEAPVQLAPADEPPPAAVEPVPAATAEPVASSPEPAVATAAAQDTMVASAADRVDEVPAEPVAAEEHASAAGGPQAGPGPDAAEQPEPRRRFWRRRSEPGPEEPAIAPAGWRQEDGRADPWEAGAELDENAGDDTAVGLEDPLVTAPPPPRGLLRRGRR